MIDGKGISFSYTCDASAFHALNAVDIDVERGAFVAVLGRNGCGKSTLVKHMNALLALQRGELSVAGIDARDTESLWTLRRKCGMVFQSPDNQFVSSIVEEDIAFGLENYGVPRAEIDDKVRHALALVGMQGYEKRAPHTLSGGQKQRVALAGVLVLKPELLIFDEATAMLDPDGRNEMLSIIARLHEQGDQTILMITHYVEEAVGADRVFLMDGGTIRASGTPREILTDAQLLQSVSLLPPTPVRIYDELRQGGVTLEHCPLTEDELVEELCRL